MGDRLSRRSIAIGISAGVLLVAGLLSVNSCGSPARSGGAAASTPPGSPAPTLPGSPGHFDNGSYSFDYPTSWHVLLYFDTAMSIGTGTLCGDCDQAAALARDIAAGKVEVRTFEWGGLRYPPGLCSSPGALSEPTVGNDSITKAGPSPDGDGYPTTTWEIRRPGLEEWMAGTIVITVTTKNPTELARTEALVASFRWSAAGDWCAHPTAVNLPGAPGHYDNGTFSFDYPRSWGVLAGAFDDGRYDEVYAVLGTGRWQSVYGNPDAGFSNPGFDDTVDVSGGRVVVQIRPITGGPVGIPCGDNTANATIGTLVVSKVGSSPTVWEIRRPGAGFGDPENVVILAWTSDAATTAQVEAMVASFQWAPGVKNVGHCGS